MVFTLVEAEQLGIGETQLHLLAILGIYCLGPPVQAVNLLEFGQQKFQLVVVSNAPNLSSIYWVKFCKINWPNN